MIIFCEIFCKIVNNIELPNITSKNKFNIKNYNDNINCCNYNLKKLIYNIYYIQYEYNYNIKYKYNILYLNILNNNSLDNNIKNYILNKFSKTQFIYSQFRKLVNIFKIKRIKKFNIDSDLHFISFSTLNKKNIINLIENNILYKFHIPNLICLINESLSNSPDFFSEPLEIKNPYTNIPFSLCNLYNIYFKIKETNFIMPILFHQFFISNFKLNIFKNKNECLIRDIAIKKFCKNASIDDKHYYLLKMIYKHNDYVLFELDNNYPKKKLVEIFGKYLEDFLYEEYSLNPYIKYISKEKIDNELYTFSKKNPNFGKRILIKKRNLYGEIYYYYYDDFINENINYNQNFYNESDNNDVNNQNNHNDDNNFNDDNNYNDDDENNLNDDNDENNYNYDNYYNNLIEDYRFINDINRLLDS